MQAKHRIPITGNAVPLRVFCLLDTVDPRSEISVVAVRPDPVAGGAVIILDGPGPVLAAAADLLDRAFEETRRVVAMQRQDITMHDRPAPMQGAQE